ncbi:MAG: hypothetical protein HWD58_12820 [Bacteroidota bacterium]|nr:MAG: hypothetical protein HWD58_12820 [Bacteroidota bacterium]
MNPILWQLMEIQTLSLSAPPYNSTFVTDICPIYDAPGLNFAFTGLLMISGDNASPIYQGTTPPVNKRIFISCMESSTYFFTTITEYDFQINSNPVEKEYFPSRIIEIPNTQSSGGFLVGGNTQYSNPSDIRQLSMFYLRTDYALNPVDQIARQIDATDEVASAFIGDLKFDPNTDECMLQAVCILLKMLHIHFCG